MKLLNNLIKFALHKKGYTLTKTSHNFEREIYNAYYLGQCFKCIKGDPLTEDILKGKIWDSQIEGILESIPSTAGLFIEVGANIGVSILPHAHHFPEHKFKLFEPVPVFYDLLNQNHKTFNTEKNVEIFNLAFGSSGDEEIEINVGLGTAGKSKLVHYQMKGNAVKMKAQTLDTYFKEQKIAFIKLDVDGHELSVLKGGATLLKNQRPQLFIEFAQKLMDDIHQSPDEITGFLKDSGYNHIKIWDHDSKFIKNTNDWDELIRVGKETPHYLNILVSSL